MHMLWEPKVMIFKVSDFESVRSFYKAVLLLRIIDEEQGKFVTFDVGHAILKLEYDDELDLPGDFGKATQLVFKVRSLKDMLDALRKLNVDYNLDEFDDGWHLDVADPEGRLMTFISKY